MIGHRYALVRESDGRFVVIDQGNENVWVYGPTTHNKANQEAKRLEREHNARKKEGPNEPARQGAARS